jgi:predicted nucleic acid-binding protein
MKGIADTGLLVAYLSKSDDLHHWAREVTALRTAPFLTCESVLSETAFHVRSSEAALDLVEIGLVEIHFDCRQHTGRLAELAKSYADRQPDFADLCLIRMSELYPGYPIVTVDEKDFQIYRRNGREAIPLVTPPRRATSRG